MFLKMPEPVAVNVNNTSSPYLADQSSLINAHDVYRVFINHVLLSSQAHTINILKTRSPADETIFQYVSLSGGLTLFPDLVT